MISRLFVGLARCLFLAAVACAALAGLFAYCAWRLLRAAFARTSPMPVRESGFALLMAAAVFAKALQAQGRARGTEGTELEHHAPAPQPTEEATTDHPASREIPSESPPYADR